MKRYAPEKTHAAWEALLAEAAGWKGRKGRLRLRRCLRHPLRALWYALQPMPRVQEHMPDIFAPSPRAWLGQVPRRSGRILPCSIFSTGMALFPPLRTGRSWSMNPISAMR